MMSSTVGMLKCYLREMVKQTRVCIWCTVDKAMAGMKFEGVMMKVKMDIKIILIK